MNGRVKYSDPYRLINSRTPTSSLNSRAMKSVTNNQLHIAKEPNYPKLDVQVVYQRPKYASHYNAISGTINYRDRNSYYPEAGQRESNFIPIIKKEKFALPVTKEDQDPKMELEREEVEKLVNGEIVPRGNLPINEIDSVNVIIEGEGLGDFFKGAFSSAKNTASKVADRVTGTAKAIFQGQSRLQPPERKLMEQYGDKVITKIVIQRAPIKTVPVDRLMNLLTGGDFNKSLKDYGYDKLFHLFMIITLEDLTEISLEKNETIQMKKSPQKSDYESLNVSLSGKVITLSELMEKTSNLMGSNFFPYHPITNNCQTFISSVMKAIGLNTSQIDNFVNQPVDKLFETYDKSGKLTSWMSKITQLGTKMNFLKRGGKIHYKMHQ